MELKPQPGPQEMFLSSPADIVIFGGAAGGGKSYALLLEGLRHIGNPDFGAVIFRKNANQIMSEGGLWDTAADIYSYLGAKPSRNPRPTWRFRSGAKISFAHLDHEKDKQSLNKELCKYIKNRINSYDFFMFTQFLHQPR